MTTSLPESYGRPLAALGAATLHALQGCEAALRRLHPPLLPRLRERLAPLRERLATRLAAYEAVAAPAGLEAFHGELARGAAHAQTALEAFCTEHAPAALAPAVLGAMRDHARAQEALYPLRFALPPLGAYFQEDPATAALDPEPPDPAGVGLLRTGKDDERGGFSLYVPECYRAEQSWPLVVALHGGFGHGRDFVWTWLREARSRGLLLLAPTSRGSTWALDRPADEAAALAQMVASVGERWNVDRARVLLTGLSDGATFTLLAGLAEGAPYSALAPVAGVLHPVHFRQGNLEHARGRRIYQVHGALDWLFPVGVARMARDALQEAGAELVYRELADLSHAYPREENARILAWFSSSSG